MSISDKRTAPTTLAIGLLCILGSVVAMAQTSSGGKYKITSSVVAGGGGSSTGSGNKVIDGTPGQPAAGPLSKVPISHVSGFWPTTLAEPKPPQGGQVTLQFSAATYLVQEDLGALAIT